jgi:poly(A) polymerase
VRQKIYKKNDHVIEKEAVDSDALAVIQTLQDAGHTAYLVGGGVRDLLLGFRPKDFDISTSARPDEIKKLFQRHCLLIGRRFRLAHLRYGQKILEVSTFRAGDPTSESLIVHDNRWGTEEEDVQRRDFTINALFYDPQKEVIIDYVGGVEDIHRRLLRTVGDPEVRFRQDPVRMIRMLKFQARFGFHCDEKAIKAQDRWKDEILKSAQARILEEILKMLESGKSDAFFRLMTDHGFTELLFPCFHHFFSDHSTRTIASSYLRAIDETLLRPAKRKLDRSVLLAAIVFPILEQELFTLMYDRQIVLPTKEIVHLTETLLHGIGTSSFVHFPRKLFGSLFLIIVNQFRLTPLKGPPKLHARFSSHEDFQNAIDFLRLRTLVDGKLGKLLDQWEVLASKKFNAAP